MTKEEKDTKIYVDSIKELEGLTIKTVTHRGKWYDHEEFDLLVVNSKGEEVGTFRIRSSNWYTKA